MSSGDHAGSRPQTPLLRSGIWVIIPTLCFVVFLFTGVVNAAQTSAPSSLWAQKQHILQQQINDGHTHTKPKTGRAMQPPAFQPAEPRQSGISNGQGPFSAAFFILHNYWEGPVGKDWVFVYSGAKPQADGTAGQGGLVLYTQVADSAGEWEFHPLGTFLAPQGTTALTIVAVNGMLVTLHSETGQKLTFNLQTQQYQ